MEKIHKVLCLNFILFLPFYDVPNTIRSGISISGIIGIILFFYWLYCWLVKKQHREKTSNTIFLVFFSILLFLFFYISSTLLNNELVNDRSLNHIIFYGYTFLIYLFVTFFIIKRYGTNWFAFFFSVSLLISSLIGFYEMSLYYTSGFNAYANFLDHGNNVGTVLGIPRLRSTFNEPSHFALYTICALPIVFFSKKITIFGIVLIALILTGSASALLSLSIIVTFYILAFLTVKSSNLIKLKSMKVKKSNFLWAIASLIFFLGFIFTLREYAIFLLEKALELQATSSGRIRFNLWNEAIKIIPDYFVIGGGAASYYSFPNIGGGLFNWYLQVLLDSGILGLTSIILLLINVFRVAFKSNISLAILAISSFSIQMLGMNHYFIPGFWVLVAFIMGRYEEIKKRKI